VKDATLRDDPGRNFARAGEAEQRGKNGAELCVVRRKDCNCLGLFVTSSALRLRFPTPLAELPDPIWGKRFWRASERQQKLLSYVCYCPTLMAEGSLGDGVVVMGPLRTCLLQK
jgi:hypothetical protein